MKPARVRRTSHEDTAGFALVAVLGLLLLVSAVLIPFSIAARVRVLTADNAMRSFQNERMAAVLASHVARKIPVELGPTALRPADRQPECRWGEYAVGLRLQNHAGLIDLNAAGFELLEAGFQSLGFSADSSGTLAHGVLQYRRIGRGSGDGPLEGILGQAGLKHAAFEDVAELHDFLPLRALPLTALTGTFTVQSQSGTLAIDAAPPGLRRILAARPADAMPYLVSTAPLRALTVSVDIQRNERLEHAYAAIFRISPAGQAFVSKVAGLDSVSTDTSLPGLPLPCPEVLDDELLRSLGGIFR